MSRPKRPGWGWREKARDLMFWVAKRLVNRRDAHGSYYLDKNCEVKQFTAKPRPGSEHAIDGSEICRHFLVSISDDEADAIVGLHVYGADDAGLWAAADIDYHGDGEDDGRNERFAIDKYEKLRAMGFHPLLTTSNGRGGYHLRVLFDRRTPGLVLHAVAKWLGSGWKESGLDREPDLFPAKPSRDGAPFGSGWLRLPGRHHRRPYWSRVWDGDRWLEEAEAVAFILALSGDDTNLVPAEILTLSPPTPDPVLRRMTTASTTPRRGDEDHQFYRARRYAERVGNRSKGGRETAAYNIAAFCRGTLGITHQQTLDVLQEWNRGNSPPLSLTELTDKAINGGKYNRGIPDTPRPPKQSEGTPRRQPFEVADDPFSDAVLNSAPPSPNATIPTVARPTWSMEPPCIDKVSRAASDKPIPRCSRGRPNLFQGIGKSEGKWAIFRPACRCYTCFACSDALRTDWKARLLPAVVGEVAIWEGSEEEFDALKSHLKRIIGKSPTYAGVRIGDGRIFAVVKDPPASPRLTPATAEDAANQLELHLGTFPVRPGSKEHPFRPVLVSKSFAGKTQDDPKPKNWRRVGPAIHGIPRTVEILESEGIKPTGDPEALPAAGRGVVRVISWKTPATWSPEQEATLAAKIRGHLPLFEPRPPRSDSNCTLEDFDDYFGPLPRPDPSDQGDGPAA